MTATTSSVPASSLAGGGRGEAPTGAGTAKPHFGVLYEIGPHPALHPDADRAACFDVDPDLFFAPEGRAGRGWTGTNAKQVCRRCPIRVACLEWAVEAGRELHGAYGATNATERDAIRFRRREVAA